VSGCVTPCFAAAQLLLLLLCACCQVEVSDLAPSSVTEYAWRVKFAVKHAQKSVKFSENATLKSEVEVG